MNAKRLKRVVRVRRLMRTTKAAELARRQAELADAEQRLQATDDALAQLDSDTHGLEFDPYLEDSALRYRRRLAQRRGHAEREVQSHEERVDHGRAQVAGAHRDLRLMEELQSRVQAREQRDLATAEGRAQDAIALSAYARKGGTE